MKKMHDLLKETDVKKFNNLMARIRKYEDITELYKKCQTQKSWHDLVNSGKLLNATL